MQPIALDTESFYHKADYSVAKLGNYSYTHDARFDCYLLSVSDGAESWVGHPRAFNWDSIRGRVLVSHNAAFDRHVVARLEELGKFPALDVEAWHCSANLTSYLCDRRALDKASEFLMGLKMSKGMRDYMNGRTWDDAVKAGKDKELVEYARHDAEIAWRLWDKFSPGWPEQERLLSELTVEGEFYGVRIDQPLLTDYVHVAEKALIANESRLPWIVEGKAPTSPIAIAAECRKVGIPCPPVKADDDEGFQAWEDTWAPTYSWVQAVASWRVINKFLATLKTFQTRLRPDGTVPVPLKYFGAHTGRWAGASGLNFLNFRKEPIFLDTKLQIVERHDLLKTIRQSVELTGQLPVWCAHALDIRKIIIPREGYKFILPDYSQIEPRVLAWLDKDWDFLDQVATGMSPYEAHARATMGWKGGKLKDEDPKLYNLAKIRVLQLGYQSGWRKLQSTAWTKLQLELSDEEAKKIVQDFRDQNPKITKVWELMQRTLKMAVAQHEDMFELELPTGRCLRYGKPTRAVRMVMNEETKQLEKKVVMTADVGGIRKQTYGGLLTENWVQATAREVFVEGLLALRKAGHRALFHVYDDMTLEVKPSVTCEEVTNLMTVTPPWLPRCPIAAEAQEASRYLK
jgi:hypothetical protein